jgi:hypothetical protein
MNCAVHPQNQAVAFCRTCGKALCEECKRDVMGAIYCEPCIAARLHGQPAVGAMAPPPSVPHGTPNPVMAGILGFIPGVGAMYNGQFMKAFAHVVIFVMLILAANSISGLFGILIGFFVLYMAFEAYKTAEAHRMGIPPPDPLGLDKLFGVQETTAHHSTPAATTIGTAPNPPAATPSMPLPQVAPPPPTQDNAPIGAIILIALGVVFLLSNFGWFDRDQVWPLFLIGIGLWIAYKRISHPRQGGRP